MPIILYNSIILYVFIDFQFMGIKYFEAIRNIGILEHTIDKMVNFLCNNFGTFTVYNRKGASLISIFEGLLNTSVFFQKIYPRRGHSKPKIQASSLVVISIIFI